MLTKRNLIIVHRGPEYERDFDEIATRVNVLDRGITVYHLPAPLKVDLPPAAWQYPTLTVALTDKFRLRIRRGPLLANRQIYKPLQHKILLAAGLPTPATDRFVPGMKLDPIKFGELVVIKPINPDLGSYGRGVELYRRRKLETMSMASFPRDHLIHQSRDGHIVQRFIDTGPLLPLYRITTLFGVPMFCWLEQERVPVPPTGNTDAEIEARQIITNTGNFRERHLSAEADILDLGARVGKAFADVPLLGIDILRDAASGRPYVLECNPGGNTWHFSSPQNRGVRCRMGGLTLVGEKKAEAIGRKMLIDQFGAWDRAAEVLAAKTQELAA